MLIEDSTPFSPSLFCLLLKPGIQGKFSYSEEIMNQGRSIGKKKQKSISNIKKKNNFLMKKFRCFGFYDECLQKYGSSDSWKIMTDTYNVLPLAAVIDHRIFACHGGLSPDFARIQDIQLLKKSHNVPYDGALCDLLWSDPNPDETGKEWEVSPRGAGYYFGIEITKKFLFENGMGKIVRAHQMTQRGCYYTHNKNCVTIFSAPNYCLRCGNKGAYMKISNLNHEDTM